MIRHDMCRKRGFGMLKFGRSKGVLLVALAALSLSACQTAGLGEKPKVAALPALPDDVEPVPNSKILAEAKRRFAEGDYGRAARYYERAVELSPRSGDAWLGLTASYDRFGRFDLADQAYAKADKVIGNTPQYHNNLGYSMVLRGDKRQALEHFFKAIDLAPKDATIRNNLRMLQD